MLLIFFLKFRMEIHFMFICFLVYFDFLPRFVNIDSVRMNPSNKDKGINTPSPLCSSSVSSDLKKIV